MAELQKENAELQHMLDQTQPDLSNPSDSYALLPALQDHTIEGKADDIQNYSATIDFELVEAFSKVEKAETPDNYKELLVALTKRLMHERMQRLLTEKQTGLMIEQERKSIRVLVMST